MHAKLVGHIGRLQAHADAILERALGHFGVETEHFDLAFGTRPQTFQDFDGGGLPGSIGPQQAEDFAFADVEIDAADGFEIAVGFVQP